MLFIQSDHQKCVDLWVGEPARMETWAPKTVRNIKKTVIEHQQKTVTDEVK
jgi:hypothetical protein